MLILAVAAAIATVSLPLHAGDDKTADLKFLVVRDENGKPVRNAAIVLHEVDKKGHQRSGGLELKTDMEGRTYYEGVPYGTLRVQVIKRGFQTYGEDFDINEPQKEFVIKLKPPKEQLSIYK